jgi:ferredoxin-NADP reductase
MQTTARILMTEFVTHDVKRFILERPADYSFLPGQATEVSINQPEWENKKRPFTFTSLEEDGVLELTIKAYFDHDGVTKRLHRLRPGDELILRDVWGAITYRGPGVFLAGGAGITPFIAILRRLRTDGKLAGNTLIFANKTARDVILEKELAEMLGENLILTLSREERPGYGHGRINKQFLVRHVTDFSQSFYVCGPDPFVADLKEVLAELGAKADSIVFER